MCVVPMIGSPPMPTAVENPMSRSSYIIWYVRVPDFETSPIRPSEVMSAGIMPAFDLPGEATPGQLGPTIRVRFPVAVACAQNSAVSCTGTPSVMTITSGMAASIASITAALVPVSGTNTTETFAPVAAIASPTVAKTGSSRSASSMVWPALRGLVPPTTLVPALIMRAPCLRPSPPVMPCTMIRLSAFRKMAMSCSVHGCAAEGGRPPRTPRCATEGVGGQLGGAPRRVVHGRDLLDDGQRRLRQDRSALGRLVTVEPHDNRVADLLATLGKQAHGGDDAVGDGIARRDAAEHVDQDAADTRVGQHDVQAVRHHLRRGAAADVEEVRRPDAAEFRSGVCHHVQCRHHQAGPVADDPDRAVQLHVVEVLGLRPRFERVEGRRVGELVPVLPE